MSIHPTAVVDRHAELDATVEVGAYAVIEGGARIAAGSRVLHHAYVATGSRIGERVQIHPFAVVGHAPQDLAYDGAPSYCEVGDGTIIREHASVHRGTTPESSTVVGRNCFIMATAHVAHNCRVGDDVKLANGALLAGYVVVGDKVFLGGNCGVHQFTRIGELVMVHGASAVTMDIPPYFIAGSHCAAGVNVIGMRRAGFGPADRAEIRDAFRVLYRSGRLFRDAVAQLRESLRTVAGRRLAEWLDGPTKRGIVAGRRRAAAEADGE